MRGPLVMAMAGVGLVAACQGNPPVHTGTGLLEFITQPVTRPPARSIARTELSLYTASPFFHWDYRGDALVNDAINGVTTPMQPFDLTMYALDMSPPLSARYRNSTPYWFQAAVIGADGLPTGTTFNLFNQHEILLFARDPHEFTDALRNLPLAPDTCNGGCDSSIEQNDITGPNSIPTEWDAAWGVGTAFNPVPVAATMFYPPTPGWKTLGPPGPTPLQTSTLTTANFWPTMPPPAGGPGALPDGSGSVKAVKVINHGLCSTFQPYTNATGTGLLDLATSMLPAIVAGFVCKEVESVELRFSRAGSFLDFTNDQEADQIGGLFVGFNVQANLNSSFGTGGPNIVWRSAHDFKLFEGRPTVSGEPLVTRSIDVQGSGSSEAWVTLDAAFTKQMSSPLSSGQGPGSVPELVWQLANEQLVFPTPLLQPPCAQTTPGDDTIPFTASPSPTDMTHCGAFISAIMSSVTTAMNDLNANPFISFFGAKFTPAEMTQIATTTLLAATPSGSFANFRCAQFADMPAPACQYVLPVKRMNIYPDGFELVFLDNIREPANPVYPIWLLALDGVSNPTPPTFAVPSLYGTLCGSPVMQTPGTLGARAFVQEGGGDVKLNCSSSGSSCTCTPAL
jgi:hypothetical protein